MSIQNDPIPTPRFTGIFIPVEILEMENLSLLETILLSWIDALFDKEKGGCWASNSYLAERLKVQENTIVKALTKLRSLGLIKDISFNGRRRVIKAMIGHQIEKAQSQSDWDSILPSLGEKSHPNQDKNPTPSYIYSKEERKENNPPSPEIGGVSDLSAGLACFLFEKLKEIIPKIRKPNLKKWQEQLELMMRVDSRPESEVKDLINFIISEHKLKSPTDKFIWSKAIQSPEKLREHYAKVWSSAQQIKPQEEKKQEESKKIDQSRENKAWADTLYEQIEPRSHDKFISSIVISSAGATLKNARGHDVIKYQENGFKEHVINHLRKSGVIFKTKKEV